MSTRFAKKLIYGTFYFVVCFLVIWEVYGSLVRPAPSCFDGIQNQGEQGVDCGGPCAQVCAGSTQTVNVLSLSTFNSSPGHVTILARIENSNSDVAAQNFAYTFNIYDSLGAVIASVPGQSFLYANEVKYLLLPNQPVSGAIDHTDLTVSTVNWEKGSTMGFLPQFAIQGLATQIGSSSVSVSGNLTDNDTATFQNVLIVAVFKDPDGNPIGASQTELDNISPNQTQSFSVIYPYVPNVNPAATEVVAYALRS